MERVQMSLTEYLRTWRTLLDKTDGKLTNYKPALEEIATDVIAEEVERNFALNKSPSGKKWKHLAPGSAQRRKVNKYNPLQILRDTLDMFTSVSKAGNLSSIHKIGPQSLTWGTKDKKAIFHQRGTSRMPRRAFMPDAQEPIPKFWLKKMAQILARYKAKIIKERIKEKGK